MPTRVVKSFADLKRQMNKDLTKFERALGKQVLQKAAKRTVQYLASNARRELPVAFGELRDSIKVVGTSVVADAPHAAAIEWGSRPHWVPFAPLLKWVQLRGFQGVAAMGRTGKISESRLSRLPGTTTAGHAMRISTRSREIADESGYSDMADGATDVSAARQVAFAIQASIAKHGTKPHHFMQRQVPRARAFLAEEVHAAWQAVFAD